MACGCHVPVFRICSTGVHLSQDILQSAGVRRYKQSLSVVPDVDEHYIICRSPWRSKESICSSESF